MKLLKYLSEHFTDKNARRWWLSYITQSHIIAGLGRFLAFGFLIQLLSFKKPVVGLLIVFFIATLSFSYGIYVAGSTILRFVVSELYPQDALTGYFLIGIGGLAFGLVVIIPALFALATVADAPVTALSYIVTYAYVVPVWSFFEVMRSYKREENEKN